MKVFPMSDLRRRCRRLLRRKFLIVVFRDLLPVAMNDTDVFQLICVIFAVLGWSSRWVLFVCSLQRLKNRVSGAA